MQARGACRRVRDGMPKAHRLKRAGHHTHPTPSAQSTRPAPAACASHRRRWPARTAASAPPARAQSPPACAGGAHPLSHFCCGVLRAAGCPVRAQGPHEGTTVPEGRDARATPPPLPWPSAEAPRGAFVCLEGGHHAGPPRSCTHIVLPQQHLPTPPPFLAEATPHPCPASWSTHASNGSTIAATTTLVAFSAETWRRAHPSHDQLGSVTCTTSTRMCPWDSRHTHTHTHACAHLRHGNGALVTDGACAWVVRVRDGGLVVGKAHEAATKAEGHAARPPHPLRCFAQGLGLPCAHARSAGGKTASRKWGCVESRHADAHVGSTRGTQSPGHECVYVRAGGMLNTHEGGQTHRLDACEQQRGIAGHAREAAEQCGRAPAASATDVHPKGMLC